MVFSLLDVVPLWSLPVEAPEELVIVGDPTAIGARSLGDMAAAVLILSAITIAGGYLPARRAANVDPMVALRYE